MSKRCPRCGVYAAEEAVYCGVCGCLINECPKCGEYAAERAAFCGVCGRPIKECPQCSDHVTKGSAFCGACGRPLRPTAYNEPASDILHTLFLIFSISLCALVLFILFFETFTMVMNTPDILDLLSGLSYYYFLLAPLPTKVFVLEGGAQLMWAAEVIIILACVAYAVIKFIKAVLPSQGKLKKGAVENTAIFWISISLCVMLVISFIVALILLMTGNDQTSPDFGSKIEQMFLLADAAVWEELVTRVAFIGVPMTIISLIVTKKKESLKCLFGGFGVSGVAVILMIISGAIFGIAHYSGWDGQAWKVLTAGIMGFFLGYVFVRFGLYASILLHFINNYLSSFEWMGAEGAFILIFLLLILAGFIALVYIAYRVWTSRKAIDSLPVFRNVFIKDG